MQSLPLPKGKAVQIYWIDSAMKSGWQPAHSKDFSVEGVSTIGYVVTSTKESLTVTCSISESDGVIAPLSIPWEAITDCHMLPGEWDSESGPLEDI